jgi:membrane associated rhomboid family serine protease
MFKNLPHATRILILVNGIAWVLEFVLGRGFVDLFSLWPLGPAFHPWQVITYAFLHEPPPAITHIFFNMFALFMFGGALERFWGLRRFLTFYFASVLAAALTELLVLSMSQSVEQVLGASGAIFGLLLGFAWYFPQERLALLFLPIPIPAWLFVTLYGAAELVLGVTGAQAGVAHFAHLGGMLGGAVMILIWRAQDSSRPPDARF